MMRNLYLITTTGFWAIVFAFWLGSGWTPQAATTQGNEDRVISASELARHARPDDCWMAIRGSVYDVTAYLPDHPSRAGVVEPWCGKEATEAYNTKTKGRPHSSAADQLLAGYRIGTFVANRP